MAEKRGEKEVEEMKEKGRRRDPDRNGRVYKERELNRTRRRRCVTHAIESFRPTGGPDCRPASQHQSALCIKRLSQLM